MSTASKKPSKRQQIPPPSTAVDKSMKPKARDYQLERMVHAQSATIDMIMKGSSDDIARLIVYLQRRIELEEGYQNSLAQIVHKLEEANTLNPLYQSAVNTHVHEMTSNYLHMGHSVRPSRIRFIQTMKAQLQSLIKLKAGSSTCSENQDRSRRSHRRNMHQLNTLYLDTRIDELPEARDAYLSKWEEIERAQLSPIPNPSLNLPTPLVANGPQHAISPSRTSFFPKNMAVSKSATTNSGYPDDLSETSSLSSATSSAISPHTLYSDDDQRGTLSVIANIEAPISSLGQIVTQSKFDSSPPPPSPQKRIHQFMKSFQINHVHDPVKNSVRLAKLKVEMNEADSTYRQVVRKLDTLAKKQQAANDFAIKALQSHLLEKSTVVKQVLDQVLMTEADHTWHENETVRSMQLTLATLQPQLDQDVFNNLLAEDKYPMPSPIYYINHHVGECKDLLFGITLVEYSQRKGRSPPMILSRCIESVERLGGLEKEGIYRVSGKQTSIEKMKQAFERDEEAVSFGQNDVPEEVYCIASVIKIFLRELSTPLFPFSLADRITYSQIPDKELRLMNLLTRILKLPEPNYDTLKAVVDHLSKLQLTVDKNKMTVSNLSLIFTPAIFQDHNHAQMSPNEWKKDCVLKDLLTNAETLFADKDLRGASAITGVIDYGFEKATSDHSCDSEPILFGEEEDFTGERDEYHLPTPDSPSAYSITYINPPATKSHTSPSQRSQTDKKNDDIEPPSNSEGILPIAPTLHQGASQIQSLNDTVKPEPSTSALSLVKEKRNSKFRTVSQDLGLTVNTHHSSIKKVQVMGKNQPGDTISDNIFHANSLTISPSIQSATVPSFDWLDKDPEAAPNPTPSLSALRRSATTGRTPLSKRKQGTVARVPARKTPSTATTACTTSH